MKNNWRTTSLSKIGTLERGKGLQKNDFTETGIPCIHYGQIFTYYDGFADRTISCVSSATAKNCTAVHRGDTILAITSENVQDLCKSTVWLGSQEIVTGSHSGVFRHNQNPKFLGYYFQSEYFNRQKFKFTKGTKVIEINPNDILNRIKIKLPDLKTQQKIVQILDTWRYAINIIEKRIDQEDNLMKYLYAALLSGYKTSNGDDNVFSNKTLGEIANIERGKTLTAKEAVPGDIPVIAGGVDSPYSHDKYTHENVITVSASGANAGYVDYRHGKIWASDCNVIYGKKGISNTMYIFSWLVLLQKLIYKLQTGGAQPHVHAKDLAKLKILLPSLKAQQNIVSRLGTQANTISQLNDYKTELEKQYKYLLNHLINGDFDLSNIKLENEKEQI